jgi:membrane protein
VKDPKGRAARRPQRGLAGIQARVAAGWRRVLWEETRLPTPLRSQLRAWDRALRSLRSDLVVLRAGALTYRTLLSLVPFLAVTFSLFRAFGGLDDAQRVLERRLVQNLAPGAAHQVSEALGGFLERIASGAVSGLGVVILIATVVTVLTAIEEAFNALWQVESPRPFLRRFVTYWAMVTVGPVLFALSFSLTSAARSHRVVMTVTDAVPGAGWVFLALFAVVPWVITCVAMTLLYHVVPHTHVRWQSALAGGASAGTLWELGKVGFTWASANLFSYDAVYGGFAALAVLLVWLQIGWVIILLGCKVAYSLQNERALVEERGERILAHAERERLALRCMIEVAQAFAAGRRPPTAEQLAAGARVLELRREVLNPLEARGLLLALQRPSADEEGDGAHEDCYLPARALSSIRLKDVVDAFRHDDSAAEDVDDAVGALVAELTERHEEALEASLGGLTLADVVARLPRNEGGGEAPGPGSASG